MRGLNFNQRQVIVMKRRYGVSLGTYRAIKRNMLRANPHCYYCCIKLDQVTATIDHFIPFAEGQAPDPDNYRLACFPCNSAKANLDPRITTGLVALVLSRRRQSKDLAYHLPRK